MDKPPHTPARPPRELSAAISRPVDETPWRGYRHPAYAATLAGHGTPLRLASSGGWVLERSIPRSPRRDAMSLYPFLSCRSWHGLADDLAWLRQRDLVSLTLVSDPMLADTERAVFEHFDIARPFKTHYLCDLSKPDPEIASRHHRYYARKAARVLEVDVASRPADHLDEWCGLYAGLVDRHGIRDLRRFSRSSFAALLDMPGLFLFRALKHGRGVGAQIVLLQGETAQVHLAAFTQEGYHAGASYLLDRATQEYLRPRVRYLNWGGGRGTGDAEAEDGLAAYKRGWSTDRRTSYLLGRIFDRPAYETLSRQATTYFPAYRSGEFA